MTFGLRHDPADVFGGIWQKLLLGAALCLPVPTFAVSGLAVPLPAAVYRAAVGIVGQTQAFTQAFSPFGGGRVEATRLLASPSEGRERSFADAPSRPSRTVATGRETGVAAAARAPARRALQTRKNWPPASPSEPAQAARDEVPQTLIFSGEPAPSTEPQEHRFTTAAPESQPSLTEHPAKDAAPNRSEQPERSDSSPRHDPPLSSDPSPRHDPPPSERGTSPPAVLSPPPPLQTGDRPILPPGMPIPETNSARAMLRALVEDNPGTPLASKLEDALDKLEKADIELAKTPPDRRAALNNIEDATGDVEAAVEHGLLGAAKGNSIMALLAEEARSFAEMAIGEAIARAGEVLKIVDAELRLAEGDVHLATGAYKQAVARYRDALSKAVSA